MNRPLLRGRERFLGHFAAYLVAMLLSILVGRLAAVGF